MPSCRKAIRNELQHGAGIGGVDGQMLFTLRHRLQQRTSIRIDHGGAPPMTPVPLVERGLPALAALRLDDRKGKFELTHFQNGGAGGGLECRPRSKAEGKTKTVRAAGDGSDAGHPDVRRYIEQPAPPPRSVLPQPRQQRLGHDVGLMLRRDRPATVATPPPQAGRIPLDQLKHAVQGRGVPGRAGGRSGTQRKRRLDLAPIRRPAQTQICRQQDLGLTTIGEPPGRMP